MQRLAHASHDERRPFPCVPMLRLAAAACVLVVCLVAHSGCAKIHGGADDAAALFTDVSEIERLAAQQQGGSAGDAVPLWSYHEKNYEIYSPQLSPDNMQLVFTRKLYAPDGVDANQYTEKELERFWERAQANPRIEEPEVVFMRLAEKNARVIDYGWEPVFSPDQKTILYAHQTKPLAGKRILAATLAGNEIRAYGLEKQQHTTVARPSEGYLSRPAFTSQGILFALSGAVNGAWGGDIGVGAVDDATGRQKVLYAPVQEHGLHHMVRAFAMGDACLVLRARPLTAGMYVADAYAYELVDAAKGTLLYSWGEHELERSMWDKVDFRICPPGELQVYDWREWKTPTPGEADGSLRPDAPAAYSSPDCAYEAVIDESGGALTIFSSRGEAERHWSTSGFIRWLAWSPDASRIVLVLSQCEYFIDTRFVCDEIVILRVSDLPHTR